MDKFKPKLSWNSSKDNIIDDFYKPALLNCELYQRLSGYFSSSTFANIAVEILEFIDANGRIQIITSPKLSTSDKILFEKSVNEREKIIESIFLDDLKNDPDKIKLEFTKLMAYMLTNMIDGKPQLEIKIALPVSGPGIYHQKIGIMKYKDESRIAFAGSVNETGTGWHENIENFTAFHSWGDETNAMGVVNNQRDFNDLWNDENSEVSVFDLPHAVREHMLSVRPESDQELENTKQRIRESIAAKKPITSTDDEPEDEYALRLRPHQNEAIAKWIKNGYRGLLEMATGTGKTFTAFGCINEIQRRNDRTITVILCPQLHLVDQWKNEMKNQWNALITENQKIDMNAEITCNSDNSSWKTKIQKLAYDFNIPEMGTDDTYITNHVVIFSTYATMAKPELMDEIRQMKGAKKFLIADEVHNVNADSSKNILLDDFEFRLGLSATPTRHLDDVGTKLLKEYFGDIVHSLNLEFAIHTAHILSTYDYFPYYVELTTDEMDMYRKLTAQIAQIEQKKEKGINMVPDSFNPYIARSNLIANASNKDEQLKVILEQDLKNNLELALIYCTSTPPPSPESGSLVQIERVKNILSAAGIDSDSITWKDKTKDRGRILKLMEKGHFDCVTAVNCLDEGVDIPSVKTGIFMASSGNPKQFIQRRGRILRKNESIGKTHATIYDILVTPPMPQTDDHEFNLSERKLIAKELLRHKEFALIASNKQEAIKRIQNITSRFEINFDDLSYDYLAKMT